MTPPFPITRDDEFYVFLKSSLPAGYRIEADPRAAYYSEWYFCYRLYANDRLMRTFSGDFREIETGSLIKEAAAVLKEIGRPH